ncbi:hypothetical protein Airi01_023820 [Actinoallomurus iriomotensis]|uniref:DUF8017 domain-containing protein n=1 Tax=Actinoallomurus iriomotensis TaxID=478107 RepID=A0A9W6RGD6_9ACTN|nr:hypothetical protein Airi01_023820 [Actinoallomurus iriomotensis]
MVYGAPPPQGPTPGGPPFPPPGGPGFPPPIPPRRSRGPLIGVIAAVALLVVVGAVVIVLTTGGDEHPAAAPTSAAPTPSPPTTPTPTPTPTNQFPPTVPGWQVIVASQKNGLSYDVPADWENKGEGSMIGLDDGSAVPETAVDYSAESEKGDCRLGGAGFRASDVDSVKDSVVQGARMWAKAAARKQASPRQSIGAPQKMKLRSGGWVEQITARVTTAPDRDNCGSTGTTIHMVALPVTGGGSLRFVLYVHTGQPGALSDADMDKVVHSVRLAK